MQFPLEFTKTFLIGDNELHFIPYQSYNASLVINKCYEYLQNLDDNTDDTKSIYAGTWAYMRPFLCDITVKDNDPSIAALRYWLHTSYETLADDFSMFCHVVDIELLSQIMDGYNKTRKNYTPAPNELSDTYRNSEDPNV